MKVGSGKYMYIHKWLREKYGKANHCEHCNKIKKRYVWALKKGFEYGKDVNNFIQLCDSCHRRYDITDEARLKQSKAKLGNKNLLGFKFSLESRAKMSKSHLGKKDTLKTKVKKSIAGKKKIITDLHRQHIKESWVIRKQKKQSSCV